MTEQMQTLAFRYLCLQSHYQKQVDFTWDSLIGAKNTLLKLYKFKNKIKTSDGNCKEWDKKFEEAVSNNLNVPKALGIMWSMLKDKNYTEQQRLGSLLKYDLILGLGLSEETTPTSAHNFY